ncbi:MAG: transposase [Caldilineales bacterium]
MTRKIEFKAGYYYHVYNRGVNGQPIFFNHGNWGYFLQLLGKYFTAELIDIVAYCLMPNHYHLLVHLKTDDLSKAIMQPFSVAYSKAINKQQARSGPLFQGPFQARWVDRDDYLLHLSRYIHLNPVQARLVQRPDEWLYSSFRDYVGLRNGTLPKPAIVTGQFATVQEYIQFVEVYNRNDGEVIEHLMLD